MLKTSTSLTADTVRIPGKSAIDLSTNIATTAWPSPNVFWRPGAIILVPDNRWREAVAAVPLIHLPRNAPILAVNPKRIDPEIIKVIRQLNPSGESPSGQPLPAQIFLIGSLGSAIKSSLIKQGFTVSSITGKNIYDLAAKVAIMAAADEPHPNLVLIPSESYLDSQAIAGFSAHQPAPLLFINHSDLPSETKNTILTIKPKAIYIVGRNHSINNTLTDEVRSAIPDTKVIRIDGSTATELSVNLAQYWDPDTMFGWGRTTARGDVFSFVPSNYRYAAIFAAMFSHMATHAPIITIPSDQSLPQALVDYLIRINPPMTMPPAPPFMRGWIIGNNDGITPKQQIEIESLLIKERGDWPPAH